MNYSNPLVAAQADYQLRFREVKNWLKGLEVNGATVKDLKFCIEILQSVAKKFGDEATISTEKLDVEKAFFDSLP